MADPRVPPRVPMAEMPAGLRLRNRLVAMGDVKILLRTLAYVPTRRGM